MKETLENLSRTVYEKQFRHDYNALPRHIQQPIADAIHDLVETYRTHPWDHPDVKYIPDHGSIWRLKVGNRGSDIDHRIFFDITSDTILFLSVRHRDNAYQE